MLKKEEFAKKWKSEHFPTQELESELPFYYKVYQKIYDIASLSVKKIDDFYIIQLLMHIENVAHLRLDLVYGKIYRRVEDIEGHWIMMMGVCPLDYDKIRDVVAEAIQTAPESSLVKWIRDSVLSGDFNQLKSVALFLAHRDVTISLLFPNSSYRKMICQQLFHDDEIADNMVASSFAFDWKDKEGKSVLERLGDCFEDLGDADVVKSLSSVRGVRLDCYQVVAFGKGMLTLRNKAGEVFENVEVPSSLPLHFEQQCLICQLVGWNGKHYFNGSGMWIDFSVFERWDNKMLWDSIEADEREDCMGSFFELPSGEEVDCYEDAYGEFATPDWNFFDDGEVYDADAILANAKRKRHNEEGRKQPNYKYQPRGKNPSQYFLRKINEVFKWTVEDVNDLNYALRVFEGWMKQAHDYQKKGNNAYAHFISSSVLFSGANYSDWYIAEYPKQANRMKKIVNDAYEVVMKTLPVDPSNWRECQLQTFKQMKSYGWKVFKMKGAIDLEKAIQEVEKMLKK